MIEKTISKSVIINETLCVRLFEPLKFHWILKFNFMYVEVMSNLLDVETLVRTINFKFIKDGETTLTLNKIFKDTKESNKEIKFEFTVI